MLAQFSTSTMNADESQLKRLTSIAVKQQVGASFGCSEMDGFQCRAVLAGMVAALKEVLDPQQFRDVIHLWDIDEPQLAELLDLVHAPEEDDGPIIDA